MFKFAVRRTKRSYCGHGCAIRSAGEVRASAPTRALMAVIAALLAVLLVPTIAFADSSIIWGPSVLPSQDIGVVVNAPDRYRAAALVLGYGDDKVSTWSDDVLAKLSNESTGGAFYTFAQKFGEVDDAVGSDNPLTAVVSAVGNSFWAIAETLYGDEIWLAGYSALEFESAASAISSVLAGGDIGGGTSGGNVFTLSQSVSPSSVTRGKIAGLGTSGNQTIAITDAPSTMKLTVGETLGTSISDYRANGYDLLVYVDGHWSSSTSKNTFYFYMLPSGSYSISNVSGNGYSYPVVTMTGSGSCKYASNIYTSGSYDDELSIYLNSVSRWYDVTRTTIEMGVGGSNIFGGYYLLITNSGTSTPQDPVIPPTNWPDEPSAPSPPELPEPGTNPTVTPTPWAPVISPTFDFDLNLTTDPTSSDLIAWVQKIYYELKAFHSDAHDWLIDIGRGFDGVVQAINHADHQIYSQLLVIDNTLRDEGLKIRNYMYQMFHWLAQQFDFQNDSFNDSNIVYWLKRIWSKLGNGDINLRPTDPTTEPDDWFDWLVKAIQNFLIGLAATSSELISEIADLASQVMHEFPFSIPWDIAAILGALATSPITPSFTITIPAIDGWWDSIDFVIDLKPFDSAAATIRLMEKLLFTGFLIWKSKDLLEFMDVTKWFN